MNKMGIFVREQAENDEQRFRIWGVMDIRVRDSVWQESWMSVHSK